MVVSTQIQTGQHAEDASNPRPALPWNHREGNLRRPLFGTDGIRGPAGDLLTPALALQVGFWAGKVLRSAMGAGGPFIIGQDSRNSSDLLNMSLSAGLSAAGVEVWNLGLCPTPAVAHLTHHTEAMGGVMVSASHNPPLDNGIKFFGPTGSKLDRSLQQEIERCFFEEAMQHPATTSWGRQRFRPELVHTYISDLQTPLHSVDLNGLRVVLDLAWGAAAHVAPAVFRAMGAEVLCLHDQPDGDRINVNCGSTHLNQLQQAVAEHQADLGIAFDGDADRALAVDAQGRVVDGDYILYFWGKKLQQENKLPQDLIVATVMSNLGFERAWEKQGGKLVRAAVGDQYVHAEMITRGAMLGGEQSGHILCPHYGISGDGVMTALHLAAIVHHSGDSLVNLMDRSFQTYPQLLCNVRVEDRDRRCHWQECQALQDDIALAESAMGDQGRILVRASGTEPLIRVMVEAQSEAMTQKWCDYLVASVERHLL
ncbi:phosphoglucosamine mutase [Lyngbya confervoides]|uniref:Phosphoglucosamine mutase n=1 Tax=Lyngbya confervoides BDU141951 TaxID=1574623 RepID=A0ABD4SZK7_9CYAN|nr:phosphoglucosamine mutase [Lyngbya confervoides]MCM1981550.1 phosphoglucosamine mutase [Lyngbya confervoides BDU141951]